MIKLSGFIPVLFTRVPVPGVVKTRLESCLGPEGCALLQRAMVLDLAATIAEACDEMVLCYSDDWKHVANGAEVRDEFISSVQEACGAACRVHPLAQEGAGLGVRMVAAFGEVFSAGADSCAVMGSDLPCIESWDIEAVREALRSDDVVFGPSVDGGYWLVGLRAPFPELFVNRQFSTDSVLDEALETCRLHQRGVSFVRSASDIDEPGDLERFLGDASSLGPQVALVLEALVHS